MTFPEDMGRTKIQAAIDEWIIGANGARDREILALRLFDGLTYEQIAIQYQDRHPECPLSVDTIRRTIYRREAQLFRHI